MPSTRRRSPSLRVPPHIFNLPVLTRLKAESNRGREITALFFRGTKRASEEETSLPFRHGLCFSFTLKISKALNMANNQQPDL